MFRFCWDRIVILRIGGVRLWIVSCLDAIRRELGVQCQYYLETLRSNGTKEHGEFFTGY
jgi:hypothetical protein